MDKTQAYDIFRKKADNELNTYYRLLVDSPDYDERRYYMDESLSQLRGARDVLFDVLYEETNFQYECYEIAEHVAKDFWTQATEIINKTRSKMHKHLKS